MSIKNAKVSADLASGDGVKIAVQHGDLVQDASEISGRRVQIFVRHGNYRVIAGKIYYKGAHDTELKVNRSAIRAGKLGIEIIVENGSASLEAPSIVSEGDIAMAVSGGVDFSAIVHEYVSHYHSKRTWCAIRDS